MHAGLPRVWQRVRDHPDLGAVIVTGVGRGFCVGMDLQRVGERGGFREHTSNKIAEIQRMTALQNDVWLPTIVAVNGVCAGGGLHFVADADVVIASEDASFVDTHVSVGQVAALEPIALAHRMGLGNALRFAVLGRAGRLDAAEALRLNLVDEVVPAADLQAPRLRAGRRRRPRVTGGDRGDQARHLGLDRAAVRRGHAAGVGHAGRPPHPPRRPRGSGRVRGQAPAAVGDEGRDDGGGGGRR